MNKNKTDQIRKYVLEALSFLDGNGIIITDWELLNESLDEFGNFEVLKDICARPEPTIAEWLDDHYTQLVNLQSKPTSVLAAMEFNELSEEFENLFDKDLLETIQTTMKINKPKGD